MPWGAACSSSPTREGSCVSWTRRRAPAGRVTVARDRHEAREDRNDVHAALALSHGAWGRLQGAPGRLGGVLGHAPMAGVVAAHGEKGNGSTPWAARAWARRP